MSEHKWYYESDGDLHARTHYITCPELYGASLSRVDVPSKKIGLMVAKAINEGRITPKAADQLWNTWRYTGKNVYRKELEELRS